MKTLIIYYSQTGKTNIVAKTLSQELNSDIVEIKDMNEKNGFLNKLNSSINAFREKKTEINPETVDISEYNLVYIGTPTWASNPTPAIITLIDMLNLRTKDIILFTTMNSSGGESALKRMREKITLRGGRVIEEFEIKTKDKNEAEIEHETLKALKKHDLNIYN